MTSFDFESIFDEAEGAGFGPSEDLTPGKYRGKIVSANWGETRGDGPKSPKAGFLLKANEGSVDKDGNDVGGDVIWLNATFSPKAKDFAARDCAALGITGKMLNADPEAAVQTAVGQEWSFEVKLSKDGKWTNCYLGKRLDEDEEDDKPAPPRRRKAKPEPEPEDVEDDDEDEEEEEEAPPRRKRKAKPAPEPVEDDDDDDDPWDV